MTKSIQIKGAKLHNLKHIDLSIPKEKLIVATGVSGSGKSSLMFDIVFEEGRSQYLRSLGVLSGIDDQEKFDSISGISPAIAVQQRIIRQSNPRSTVGSKSSILNLLYILFSIEGNIQCSNCGELLNHDLTCAQCGNIEERLLSSSFAYTSPDGMCIKCSGRGSYFAINFKTLAPDNCITLREVFIKAGITPGYERLLTRKYGNYMDTPFLSLPNEIKQAVVYGEYSSSNTNKRSYCLTRIFEGHLNRRSNDISDLYAKTTCPDCHGFRISDEARSVTIENRHIGELGLMTISELDRFLESVSTRNRFSQYGKNILNEILQRIKGLLKVRLGHLTLYRELPSLSGGEIQRLFLASHLDSQQDSLIYVLDEPSAGLHEVEKKAMLQSINELKELGNTVIVIEHDRNTIEMAEHIIDIGPKAGSEGGEVIYQGDWAGLIACDASITSQYLSGRLSIPNRKTCKLDPISQPKVTVRNAQTNNLKNITASFPLSCLVGVAGVSGSGKSSLVSDTLLPLLKGAWRYQTRQNRNSNYPLDEDESEADTEMPIADLIEGTENISGYAEISQAPIGRNMNSNPVTYIGIWDKIRKIFAQQPSAKQRGLSSSHFSFNSQGACSACNGTGQETIWLGGDQNIYRVCRECHGKRYNEQSLSIKYKGKKISDVLEMTVSDAVLFFEGHPNIISVLKILDRIGMGYIKLGQPTPTLSGGEAQRIKLAKQIGKKRSGNILYILDEPSTGLSLYDTSKLIVLLDELISKGNSVIMVEHDPDLLKTCDWIIELGPGGGYEGGKIIAEGTLDDLKTNNASITGRYLN
jgi:excinuclease ABC subunit A